MAQIVDISTFLQFCESHFATWTLNRPYSSNRGLRGIYFNIVFTIHAILDVAVCCVFVWARTNASMFFFNSFVPRSALGTTTRSLVAQRPWAPLCPLTVYCEIISLIILLCQRTFKVIHKKVMISVSITLINSPIFF